ncbi:MAG: RNA polymerase sigma factor [Balneolaceae bacterium]
MNYAPLVKAIQEGDQETANRLVSEATPILIRMLEVRMDANRQDAEDAVQKMFLYVIEAIKNGKIRNPSGLLSYMVLSCRHNYLKQLESQKTDSLEDQVHEPGGSPEQLSNLINKDLQKIHVDCIQNLKPRYREFYIYWLNHRDAAAADIAEHFGISLNNAWTRKHRVLKQIQNCMKSKMEK